MASLSDSRSITRRAEAAAATFRHTRPRPAIVRSCKWKGRMSHISHIPRFIFQRVGPGPTQEGEKKTKRKTVAPLPHSLSSVASFPPDPPKTVPNGARYVARLCLLFAVPGRQASMRQGDSSPGRWRRLPPPISLLPALWPPAAGCGRPASSLPARPYHLCTVRRRLTHSVWRGEPWMW